MHKRQPLSIHRCQGHRVFVGQMQGYQLLVQQQCLKFARQRIAAGDGCSGERRRLGQVLGLVQLKSINWPGHVGFGIAEKVDGAVGQQVIQRGAQGAAFGIARTAHYAEGLSGGQL